MTDRGPDRTRGRRAGPRVLGGARAARPLRRARALPAAQHPEGGLGRSSTPPARRSAASGRSATGSRHEERVELLRAMGVRRFSTLPYAHKPGVAAYLNDWSRAFAADVPEVLWSGDVLPRGRRRRRTSPSWSTPASSCSSCTCRWGSSTSTTRCSTTCGGCSRTPTCRSSCTPARGRSATTSPGRSRCSGCSTRHPRLPIIVAHMGAPEVVRFLRLAEGYERVRLDTTMVFTDFFGMPYPDWLVPRLVDLQPKILLGTDFPTIPYPYAAPARGAGPPRPRRRLAARGLLGERRRAVRAQSARRCQVRKLQRPFGAGSSRSRPGAPCRRRCRHPGRRWPRPAGCRRGSRRPSAGHRRGRSTCRRRAPAPGACHRR